MVTEPKTQAERVSTLRDIEREAARLAGEDAPREIIFQVNAPGRVPVSLWRISDGREIRIPNYMLRQVLSKVNPDGTDIFTGVQSDAAEYKPGTVLCFMHIDSPERDVLNDIGLGASPCPKSNLRNNHSKRMHAIHKHKQEWTAYQDHLEERKEEAAIDRQERQLDATLELARGATQTPSDDVEACPADGCDYTGTKAQLRGHKSIHK